MTQFKRREFVQMAALAGAASQFAGGAPAAGGMRLGLITGVRSSNGNPGQAADAAIGRVRDFDIPTCQVSIGSFGKDAAEALRSALDKYQIEATCVVTGGPGRDIYNFYDGPLTIGLVPRATRQARIDHLKQASDFAKECGIPAVQTHCGFIPENPNEPLYGEVVQAIGEVAKHCKANGQNFRCETGQETPITLVRAIRDVGLDNVGINFDVANLILYGKANPVDAVDLLSPYVQGVHAKDGLYPTDTKQLGREVPIGQGKVDFPEIIRKLKKIGYSGALTIEREISGPKQAEDIRASKLYLEKLLA